MARRREFLKDPCCRRRRTTGAGRGNGARFVRHREGTVFFGITCLAVWQLNVVPLGGDEAEQSRSRPKSCPQRDWPIGWNSDLFAHFIDFLEREFLGEDDRGRRPVLVSSHENVDDVTEKRASELSTAVRMCVLKEAEGELARHLQIQDVQDTL